MSVGSLISQYKFNSLAFYLSFPYVFKDSIVHPVTNYTWPSEWNQMLKMFYCDDFTLV